MPSTTTGRAGAAASGAPAPEIIAATLPFANLEPLGAVVGALETAGHTVRLDVARSRGVLFGVSVVIDDLTAEDSQ